MCWASFCHPPTTWTCNEAVFFEPCSNGALAESFRGIVFLLAATALSGCNDHAAAPAAPAAFVRTEIVQPRISKPPSR